MDTLHGPLFCLGLLFLVTIAAVEAKTHWADLEALREFKNAVDPDSVTPGSCLSTWDFSSDPCDSIFGGSFTCGFRCDATVAGLGRVTELGLDQAGYSGSLESVSFNLPYLLTLDLTGNAFAGAIPSSLSNLTRLSRLALTGNSFSGAIPKALGSISTLQELFLDNNKLQGSVPSSFNSLSSLNRLELQMNRLSGGFPSLGSLKNLYYLDISENGFSGRAPSSLPENLVQLSMRNNTIEGEIPSSLRFLSYLQVLDLSRNRLNGAVPSFLFTHPSLQQLTVSFNNLSSVDAPSGPLGGLIAIDLSNNRIRGLLPLFMGLMPKLSALSVENNQFTGLIPTVYALKAAMPTSGFDPFLRLLLNGNYLFGPIPSPLMGLKPGSADVKLEGNCLFRCPATFFFCRGGEQKPSMECRRFSPVIP